MSVTNTVFSRKVKTIATELASKSPCVHKHGAVITRGNRVIATGYNTNERTSFLGKHDCCMHAEMAAALQFMNSVVLKNKKRYCF